MELSVNIDEIKHDELRVDRPLPAEWLGEVLGGDEPTPFTPEGQGKVVARLTRLATSYLLQAEARVRVTGPCKRCLTQVTFDVRPEFTLNLVQDAPSSPKAAREAEDAELAGTFESDDADQEHFHGKVIDLGRIVREQLLLALPMDALCREDCKGLCTVCGNNLNDHECGCDRRPVDPRFAVLKNLKL